MAITNNPLLGKVSGALGRQIVFKQYYGRTVISTMPNMSNRILSEKQKEWNMRMKMATAYARHICGTEEGKLRARIRFKVPAHKAVFNALVKAHLDMFKHLPLDESGDITGTELDFLNRP